MTKKTSRIIACLMLLAAAVFLVVALTHPQMGFPWSNTVTYTIYGVYLALIILLFVAPFRKG